MKIAMKTKNIFKGLCLTMLAMTALVNTSCKDEPDKYEIAGGRPTIHFVRPVSVESRDSIITAASLRQTICIVGENLRSVNHLLFNDQEAVLNSSYITDNTLIVTVPNEIPETVTDKIYFVASGDTVNYDFHVTIPAPVVASMSNEWASAGDEVTIIGDYFLDYADFPLTVNFGETQVPRSAIKSITKNRIVFTLPSDMPNEKVSVTSIYGKTNGAFQYRDSRGMLFDFDTPCKTGTVLGNNGWHNRVIQADATSLSGNYLVMGGGAAMGVDGGWNDGDFSFEYWAGDWGDPESYPSHPRINDLADFSDFENLSLKFEMNIPKENAWSAAPMQIFFGGVDKISCGNAGVKDIYGNTLAGCNNTFFHEQGTLPRALYMPWKDQDDKLYHTDGQWMTVTLPLSDFVYDYDGNKLSSGFTSAADFGSFNIFIIKGGYNDKSALPEGVDCMPFIKIDNIRVVPNK